MALRFGSGDNKPGDKAWVVSEAGAESANPYFCYEYRRGVPRKVTQRHRGLLRVIGTEKRPAFAAAYLNASLRLYHHVQCPGDGRLSAMLNPAALAP